MRVTSQWVALVLKSPPESGVTTARRHFSPSGTPLGITLPTPPKEQLSLSQLAYFEGQAARQGAPPCCIWMGACASA